MASNCQDKKHLKVKHTIAVADSCTIAAKKNNDQFEKLLRKLEKRKQPIKKEDKKETVEAKGK